MNINFKIFSLPSFISNTTTFSFLKEQQRKIISLVTVVFACLAAYAIYRGCLRKGKKGGIRPENLNDLASKKITVLDLNKGSCEGCHEELLKDKIFDPKDDFLESPGKSEIKEKTFAKIDHELAHRLDFEFISLSEEEKILANYETREEILLKNTEISPIAPERPEEAMPPDLKSTALDLSDIASEFFDPIPMPENKNKKQKAPHTIEYTGLTELYELFGINQNEIEENLKETTDVELTYSIDTEEREKGEISLYLEECFHNGSLSNENSPKCSEQEFETLLKEFYVESVNPSLIPLEETDGPIPLLLIENGSHYPLDNLTPDREKNENLSFNGEKEGKIESNASSPLSNLGEDQKLSKSPFSEIEELTQADCISLICKHPNDPKGYCALALTLMKTQIIPLTINGISQDFSAKELALKSLEIDPDYLLAYIILGKELDSKESVIINSKEFFAIDCYIQVIHLDARYFKAYYSLANLLGKGEKIAFDGKTWNRASLYKKTIELNPNYYKTYKKIASCLEDGKTFKINGIKYSKAQLLAKAAELSKR